MQTQTDISETLSPWWRRTVVLTIVLEFTLLIWLAVRTYSGAPPIPGRVVSSSGETIFTRRDILAGQQVFLKYGLMENGSIWGHGAYLGPDFSAEYLHTLSTDAAAKIANRQYGRGMGMLTAVERDAVHAEVQHTLKQNRYDPQTKTLIFTNIETASYQGQIAKWRRYFSQPAGNAGLPVNYIKDAQELRQVTAFFAWTAWASVANRPGASYSYTNNFPYDPTVGNTPTVDAVLWSALSLITLLAGTGLALLLFGRFNFLGWKSKAEHVHPQMLPGIPAKARGPPLSTS